MTGNQPVGRVALQTLRSVMPAVLMILGGLTLYQNAAGAINELLGVLGANGSQTLGWLAALALALSKAHSLACDRCVAANLVHHALIAIWPLFMVRAGAVLSHANEQRPSRSDRQLNRIAFFAAKGNVCSGLLRTVIIGQALYGTVYGKDKR